MSTARAVLVTGATGLIGRQVVAELVKSGQTVVGVDRKLDSRLELIPDEIRREVAWFESDTRERDVILRGAGVDVIAHLAAGASFLMYEEAPVENTSGTIVGFQNVLEAALEHDVQRVVYASTSAVYEGNPVPYNESMPLRPPDLKAFSKKVNEELAAIYSQRYGIETLALRPFSVYGEDEIPKGKYANVVSLFVWAMMAGRRPILWGDGSQTRDFIHVSDVADAFVRAVNYPNSAPPALNVGTGVETSFSEVLRLIADKLGSSVEPLHVDVPITIYAQRLLADTSLCEQTLGFNAKVALSDGIDRVISRISSLASSDQRWALSEHQETVLRERGVQF